MKFALSVPRASPMGAYCSLTGFALHSHAEKAEERDLRKVGGSGWLFGKVSTLHWVSLIDVHCRQEMAKRKKKHCLIFWRCLYSLHDLITKWFPVFHASVFKFFSMTRSLFSPQTIFSYYGRKLFISNPLKADYLLNQWPLFMTIQYRLKQRTHIGSKENTKYDLRGSETDFGSSVWFKVLSF